MEITNNYMKQWIRCEKVERKMRKGRREAGTIGRKILRRNETIAGL